MPREPHGDYRDMIGQLISSANLRADGSVVLRNRVNQVIAVIGHYSELRVGDDEVQAFPDLPDARLVPQDARQARPYRCPECGTTDPEAYKSCQWAGCPDGRDPR